MTRREYGTGTIERRQTKHGLRFSARIRLPDGSRMRLGTFATEDEAARVIAAAADDLEGGEYELAGSVTLAAYGATWLKRREESGHRNHRTDLYRWDRHVSGERFAQGPIAEIQPRDIRHWVERMMKRRVRRTIRGKGSVAGTGTLSRGTVKHCLTLVRLCLKAAAVDGHLDENPAQLIAVPKGTPRTEDAWTYLKQEEIERLLSCDEVPGEKRLIFQFAIYSGLRAGEIWGLRWEDVSEDFTTITVRRSYDGVPKNGKARVLPLLSHASAALERWRRLSKSKKLVFPAEHGGCYAKGFDAGWSDKKDRKAKPSGIRAGWKSKAGIERKVRFHDLRHTCASHLVSGTWGRAWRLEEVRDYLGHSNISVTQIYAHLSPTRLRGIVAATRGSNGPNLAPGADASPSAPAETPAISDACAESDAVPLHVLEGRRSIQLSYGRVGARCSMQRSLRALGRAELVEAGAVDRGVGARELGLDGAVGARERGVHRVGRTGRQVDLGGAVAAAVAVDARVLGVAGHQILAERRGIRVARELAAIHLRTAARASTCVAVGTAAGVGTIDARLQLAHAALVDLAVAVLVIAAAALLAGLALRRGRLARIDWVRHAGVLRRALVAIHLVAVHLPVARARSDARIDTAGTGLVAAAGRVRICDLAAIRRLAVAVDEAVLALGHGTLTARQTGCDRAVELARGGCTLVHLAVAVVVEVVAQLRSVRVEVQRAVGLGLRRRRRIARAGHHPVLAAPHQQRLVHSIARRPEGQRRDQPHPRASSKALSHAQHLTFPCAPTTPPLAIRPLLNL